MFLIPILTTTLLLAAPPSDAPAARGGYLPSGSPADLYDLGRLARLRDSRARAVGFSSYDRKGGNDDGFNGTYSKLRVEDGNSVLAELDGPGIIQRIWFTHTGGDQPGLLDRKNEHIKIYLDGKADPALDIPLETLFSGEHPHFPRPLVAEGSGGFVSYVPIGFRNGCKVVVEGEGVRFYQINMLSLPDGSQIEPFQAEPTPETARELEKARTLWREPASLELTMENVLTANYEMEATGNSEVSFVLPPGPATVRSIQLEPTDATAEAWRDVRFRIDWDRAEGETSAVDLPVGLAFGTPAGAISYSSLLMSQYNGVWFNRFPMPYREQGILRFESTKPIKAKMRVLVQKGTADDAGYLHADFREATPPKPGEDFSWLNQRGRGHFAGVFMWTQGKAKLPFWLEGDDRFHVDGKLAIHGTGSEDYFNCGWYALKGRLDGPAAHPSHGFPIYRSPEEGVWQAAAYRWHVADPVPFAQSIEAGIEHGGDNQFPADYRASVFWYSSEPGTGDGGR